MMAEHDIQALFLCFKILGLWSCHLLQLLCFVSWSCLSSVRWSKKTNEVDPRLLEDVTFPDRTAANLGPFAQDPHSVLEYLCLLGDSEIPHLLDLE